MGDVSIATVSMGAACFVNEPVEYNARYHRDRFQVITSEYNLDPKGAPTGSVVVDFANPTTGGGVFSPGGICTRRTVGIAVPRYAHDVV